jgi:hypothetical protein
VAPERVSSCFVLLRRRAAPEFLRGRWGRAVLRAGYAIVRITASFCTITHPTGISPARKASLGKGKRKFPYSVHPKAFPPYKAYFTPGYAVDQAKIHYTFYSLSLDRCAFLV